MVFLNNMYPNSGWVISTLLSTRYSSYSSPLRRIYAICNLCANQIPILSLKVNQVAMLLCVRDSSQKRLLTMVSRTPTWLPLQNWYLPHFPPCLGLCLVSIIVIVDLTTHVTINFVKSSSAECLLDKLWYLFHLEHSWCMISLLHSRWSQLGVLAPRHDSPDGFRQPCYLLNLREIWGLQQIQVVLSIHSLGIWRYIGTSPPVSFMPSRCSNSQLTTPWTIIVLSSFHSLTILLPTSLPST